MSLTEQQHRSRARTMRAALIVKVTIPSYGDIYLSDVADPWAIPGIAVNPIIERIESLDMATFGQVADMRLRLSNKKITRQARNPIAEPVKFSDLIASGLARATIEMKELVASVKPVTITSWTSDDLRPIFSGTIRTPFNYTDQIFTLSATTMSLTFDESIPSQRLGEHSGLTIEGDMTVLPLHLGENRAWIGLFGSKDTIPGFCQNASIGRLLQGSHAPIWRYPATQPGYRQTLIRSVDEMLDDMDYLGNNILSVKLPSLPGLSIVPRNYWRHYGWAEQYAPRTHETGYRLLDLVRDSQYFAYYPCRCNANDQTTHTYAWTELAPELSSVNLNGQKDCGAAVPVLTAPGAAHLDGVIFFVPIRTAPLGTSLQLSVYLFERGPGGQQIHCGDEMISWAQMEAGGAWTTMGRYLEAKSHFPNRGWPADRNDLHWNAIGGQWGLRLRVARLDDNGGDCYIDGIYALVGFRQMAPKTSNKETASKFYFAGPGPPLPAWPSGASGRAHPQRIMQYILLEYAGVKAEDIDMTWESDEHFADTAQWRFGWGLDTPMDLRTIMRNLEEQSTLMLSRDSDGKYRLRCQARANAKPEWQRFGHALVLDQDIFDLTVEQPGADYVKNVIEVEYAFASGASHRTAWISPDSSGDGEGGTVPDLVTLAAASAAKYGTRRKTISAWAVRDEKTAIGIAQYYLIRHSEVPNQLRFSGGGLMAYLHVGQYFQVDHIIADTRLKLGGGSWASKWFQVSRKSRWGDYWRFEAVSVPDTAIVRTILILRPYIRGPVGG